MSAEKRCTVPQRAVVLPRVLEEIVHLQRMRLPHAPPPEPPDCHKAEPRCHHLGVAS